MLRVLGLILLVSWLSYPLLVLSGASHRTTYITMGCMYVVIGLLFLIGMLPLLRRFLFFQEKALSEFPRGFARTVALVIFGEIGVHRSKLEWIIVVVFGGAVFLTVGIALLCLGADFTDSYQYLKRFFS